MKDGVTAYIARAPKAVQGKLREVRAAIKAVAPDAAESISYRMPHYRHHGPLVWFASMKGYIGLYLRPPIIAEHARELAKYQTTKSAIHFPLEKKLPVPLIKKLVRAGMEKNGSAGAGDERFGRRARGGARAAVR